MLAKVEAVRVLQKQVSRYEDKQKLYVMVGDGDTSIMKFRIDNEEVFHGLKAFDLVDLTLDLYVYGGQMYGQIVEIEKVG